MKTKLFIVGLCLVVVLCGMYVFYTSTFRVTDTNFPNNQLPMYENKLDLYFSKNLQPDQNITISISESDVSLLGYKISGNRIKIELDRNLTKNEKMTFRIAKIISTDNKALSLDYTVEGVFVPESKISKAELEVLKKRSQNNQDAITGDLPIISENYEINYAYTTDPEKLVIIITSHAIPEAFADTGSYLARIREDRNFALTLIANKGYDLKKYNIYYQEDILLDEFNAQSINTLVF